MLVVHPHLHLRYTGVTRHLETVLPLLGRSVEARTLGWAVDGALPRIERAELLRRAASGPLVWHAHRVNELLSGLWLRARRPRVRVVFTRHAVGRPSGLTRWAAARADARISVSPEAARDLGLGSEVVLHGVDLRRFSPPADRAAAWARLGIGGTHGLGVVGRIRPDKGVGELLDAAAPVLRRHPGWRLVLIGAVGRAHQGWLEERRARAGGALHLAGEQREVEAWYRGLSVVVSPSHEESFGLVRAEALASGCCLVATRLNALDQALTDRKDALLYRAGDVAALGAALEEVCAAPALAESLGREGAAFAARTLDAEAEAAQLLRVYRALVDGAR